MEKLVVYFSMSGNTKKIVDALPYEKVAVELVNPLPKNKFYRFFYCGYLASTGKVLEVKPLGKDLSKYQEIVFATPVWAGKPSTPMFSFLKTNKIENKQITLITTSGGADQKVLKILKDLLPNNRIVSETNVPKNGKLTDQQLNNLVDTLK